MLTIVLAWGGRLSPTVLRANRLCQFGLAEWRGQGAELGSPSAGQYPRSEHAGAAGHEGRIDPGLMGLVKGDVVMSRNANRAGGLVLVALAAVLLAPSGWAGTTGKLSGKVVNEKKEPLAGVNIRIEGQRLGGISDEQGNYFIIGITAGTYNVRASLMGQAPFLASNVVITPDFTTTLNIPMRVEAVELGEVKVDAQRPLLQKDATGTTRFLSSQDLAKLPTRGYRDAAAQQTGVVNFDRQIDSEVQNSNTLIVRGGRPNETPYYVDGFSQQDPLTGTSSTATTNNALEEVVLLTAGFC